MGKRCEPRTAIPLSPSGEASDIVVSQLALYARTTRMPAPFLKAVFHVHTIWSRDASMTPHDLIHRCLEHGVDVLAVTDHNEVEGAREVARHAPFQVIVGEEVRTAEGGEIIGLFLRDRIPRLTPARETIRRIKDQGGLVYLPHPFDEIRRKQFPPSFLDEIASDVDIVETFNARNVVNEANVRARAYAEKYGKVSCAGADAHIPPEIGRTYVELPPFSTPEELLASLRVARLHEQKNGVWVHWASAWYRLTKHPSHQ